MKRKIFLATTALGLLASAANASKPVVTIGMYSDVQFSYSSQDFDSKSSDTKSALNPNYYTVDGLSKNGSAVITTPTSTSAPMNSDDESSIVTEHVAVGGKYTAGMDASGTHGTGDSLATIYTPGTTPATDASVDYVDDSTRPGTNVLDSTDPNTYNPVKNLYSENYQSYVSSSLYVNVDGKTDSGMLYGGYIQLNADVSPNDEYSNNANAEMAYAYLGTPYARVQLGAFEGSAEMFSIGVKDVAVADGGVSGNYWKYANLYDASGLAPAGYYVLPGLVMASGLPGEVAINPNDPSLGTPYRDRATLNKIGLFSAKISGFQFGATYAPSEKSRGNSTSFSSEDLDTGNFTNIVTMAPQIDTVNDDALIGYAPELKHYAKFKNIFDLGFSYEHEMKDMMLKFSGTWEHGQAIDSEIEVGADTLKFDDLNGFELGVMLSSSGFTGEVSGGLITDLGAMTDDDVNVKYMTAGAGYGTGPFGVSVTFFGSRTEDKQQLDDRDYYSVSLGGEYKAAPGFTPYVEWTYFNGSSARKETDPKTISSSDADNSGQVFLIGARSSF